MQKYVFLFYFIFKQIMYNIKRLGREYMEYAINENNKNIEKDNMDEVVPPVQRASLSKRIIAGILDFFIFVFLMFLIQPFAINPADKHFAKDYNVLQIH